MVRLLSKIIAVACLMTLLVLQSYPVRIRAESNKFEIIEEANEVEIAYFENGLENFRVVINKNGGIAQILISQIPYVEACGVRIAADTVTVQTANSDAINPPEIVKSSDESYVEARFYGKYRNGEIYFNTSYIISKIGLILISSVAEAKRDELSVTQTTWSTRFPINIFKNEKVRVGLKNEIREYTLSEEVTSGAIFNTQAPVYWIDFSRSMEGVTLINMAPQSDIWYETTISDQRQYGRGDVYEANFIHTASGQAAMPRGTKRLSKVALYLHGPGSYEGNKEVIDLISALAEVRVQCEKAMAKYQENSENWNLASQAMEKANSGIEKMIRGDMSGASTDLENAKSILSNIKEGGIGITLQIAGLVIILLVVIVLAVLMRRRAKKTQK